MWFTYMDESGNTGMRLDDPMQPVHLIAAVLVPEEKVTELHEKIAAVGKAFFGGHCNQPDFELHAAEMFRGEGCFRHYAPDVRVKAFEAVLSLIGELGLRVIIRGVHKPGLKTRYPNPYHPHDISLKYVIEEVELFAKSQEQAGEQRCLVLLIADNNEDREEAALRNLRQFQTFGTGWGWAPVDVDHIVDTIHFVDSQSNPAMQLADLVAFVANRNLRVNLRALPDTRASQAVMKMHRELVQPNLYTELIWYPVI